MSEIIYFREYAGQHGVFRFVKSFRRGGFLKREKIEYTTDITEATRYGDPDNIKAMFKRIRKDYPYAYWDSRSLEDFKEAFKTHRFFLITKITDDNSNVYYCGEKKGMFDWTSDINEALIGLDSKTQAETALRIRMKGGKVNTNTVYLDLINDLLNPNFMITCESKSGKKEIKYFARKEGNRLRLVETSASATKFSYREVMSQYEELQGSNKNFLYSVLPVFKDNVSYKNLKQYIREHNVSNRLQMEIKLKNLHDGKSE